MKVLIYSHSFAPQIGGVETYVMTLARGLAARSDHDCAVHLGRSDTVVVATSTPSNDFDDASLPFRVCRRPSLSRLWRLVGDADIVQLAGPVLVPLALGLVRGKPLVVEHHGYQVICPNGLLFEEPAATACPGHFMAGRYANCFRCRSVEGRARKALRDIVLTFVRRWLVKRVAVNAPITRHVLKRLELPRSEVLYYGVPVVSRQMMVVPDAGGESKPEGRVAFAYIGRLVREKGLDFLLRAASLLKEKGYSFSVTFVGDGPERRRLETLVSELALGDRIEFAGWLQGDALEAAMRNVEAVLMPSIWEETAGLAVMEQMMCGRLVIAADIGGLGEIVDDAGLKFQAGDLGGLEDCMRRVIEGVELTSHLRSMARARALGLFREESMVDAHVRLYSRLRDPIGLPAGGTNAVV